MSAVKIVMIKNLRRPGHLGDQDINGKVILKGNLKECLPRCASRKFYVEG